MTCVKRTTDKLIVFEEKSRKAVFANLAEREFDRAIVDGCLITESIPKCDNYLRNDETIWLVELKGKDVERAVTQIVGTSKELASHVGTREIIPVIVASRCPAISGQQKSLRGLKGIQGNLSKKVILRSRVAKISP